MKEVINVSEIKLKIKEHLDQAHKLQAALDLLIGNEDQSFTLPSKEDLKVALDRYAKGQTFRDSIKHILTKQDKPLRGRALYDRYLNRSGKTITYNSFSAQLSSLIAENTVKKHIIQIENSNGKRFYYGLTDWFLGSELKEDYLKKIKPDEDQA